VYHLIMEGNLDVAAGATATLAGSHDAGRTLRVHIRLCSGDGSVVYSNGVAPNGGFPLAADSPIVLHVAGAEVLQVTAGASRLRGFFSVFESVGPEPAV
jgi:hypothetical protein